MDLRDILNSLTTLSEATKETGKGRVHKADPGGYGRKYDTDDEGDEKGEKKEKKPEEKKGRGRPKKDGDTKQYDTDDLGKAFGVGKPPKKPVGKPSKKHTLKDWMEYVETNTQLNEAEQVSIVPAQSNTQVIKQGQKTLGTVTNPQLAQQIKQSIGKGEMTLAGDELGETGQKPHPKELEIDAWVRSQGIQQRADAAQKKLASTPKTLGQKLKKDLGEPLAKLMRGDIRGGLSEEDQVEESGLQAYLGNKKYGKEGMDALRKAGRDGAGKEKMANIRAKYDKMDEEANGDGALRMQGQNMDLPMNEKAVSKAQQKFMGMVHAAQKGKKPASKAVADVAKSMGKKDAKDFAATKHKGLPEKVKKTDEAISDASLIGKDVLRPKEKLAPHAGMGKGKLQQKLGQAGVVAKNIGRFLKGKPEIPTMENVDADGVNVLTEGAMKDLVTRFIEDLTTSKARGFNINNAVEMHDLSAAKRAINNTLEHGDRYKRLAGTLKGQLRDYALEEFGFTDYEGSLEEADTRPEVEPVSKLRMAKTDEPEISPFRAGTPQLSLENNMKDIQFEGWEKQLNNLLTEGLTVSSSTGQQGAPDSVTISATDHDAHELLSLVRKAGLGVFGGDENTQTPDSMSSALMSVPGQEPDGYGTEPEASPDVVGDGDDMLMLIKKMAGVSNQPPAEASEEEEDYEDEESEDSEEDEEDMNSSEENSDEEDSEDEKEVEESYDSDMEEGNAFTGALAKAKSDGVQKGETMKVGGKTYPVKEDDMEEGNAFTGKLKSTPKGGEFELDGKSYKDTSNIEEEALDQPATMEEKMCEVHGMNEGECGCNHMEESFANDAGQDAMAQTELAKLKALLSMGNDLHKMKKDQTVMNPTQVTVRESINEWKKLSGIK